MLLKYLNLSAIELGTYIILRKFISTVYIKTPPIVNTNITAF
jgi:hypothetical protein